MPYLIPDDWDGETWTCVQLQWPNSPAYLGILRGVLSLFQRGRTWDAATGTIIDQQEVGWEIWLRNFPFNACTDTNGGIVPPISPETPLAPPGGFWGGDFDNMEEWLAMTGGIIDIRCENGVLQVMRFPCCTWYDVCSIGDIVREFSEDESPYDPDPGTSAAYSCRKAAGAARALAAGVEVMWDFQNGGLPLYYVTDNAPQLGWDVPWLNRAWIAAKAADWSDFDANQDTYEGELACLWAALLDETANGLSSADFTALKQSVLQSSMPAATKTVYQYTMEAMMLNTLSNYAMMNLEDTAADCTCPSELDPLEEPTENGWYLGPKYADLVISNDGTQGWVYDCITDTLTHDIYGIVFTVVLTGTPPQWSQQNNSDGPCTGITALWGDSSQPSSNWNCAAGHTDVLTEIFGPGGWTSANGGQSWSNVVATPNHLKDAVVGASFNCGFNKSGTVTVTGFRFIHNTGSPSHT